MRTLAFFNGKGGSGKTSFTIMMASWLRFHEGARVCVFDLDAPEFKVAEQRGRDIEMASAPDSRLRKFLSEETVDQSVWYDVISLDLSSAQPAELDDFSEYVKSLSGTCDYVFLDFGAGLRIGSPAVEMMRRRVIDLVVIPVYSDKAVLASALSTALFCNEYLQRSLVFWNRVVRGERGSDGRDRLKPLSELFEKRGVKVASTRIGEMTIFRRDASTWHFLKSTACWPEENVKAMCPDLEALFIEIRSFLGETV